LCSKDLVNDQKRDAKKRRDAKRSQKYFVDADECANGSYNFYEHEFPIIRKLEKHYKRIGRPVPFSSIVVARTLRTTAPGSRKPKLHEKYTLVENDECFGYESFDDDMCFGCDLSD
jgi:hypothetical protein